MEIVDEIVSRRITKQVKVKILTVEKAIADSIYNEQIRIHEEKKRFWISNGIDFPIIKGFIRSKLHIVIPECPFCGGKHIHGNAGYRIGTVTRRHSHCGIGGQYFIVLYKRKSDIENN